MSQYLKERRVLLSTEFKISTILLIKKNRIKKLIVRIVESNSL